MTFRLESKFEFDGSIDCKLEPRCFPTELTASMRPIICAILLSLLHVSTLWAQFSQLTVFGDSLSDTGNIQKRTFGIQPGSDYFRGRFSNGPVYAELLATRLGIGPLLPTEDGGTNYAHGGARTTGSPFFEGLFIEDIDEQVDSFLDHGSVDEQALYVVLAGGNDLFDPDVNPTRPASILADQIGRLVAAGIRNLLSINLTELGETPRFRGEREAMNARTREFNQTLADRLDGIAVANPGLSVFRLDAATLFSQVIALPRAFGFSDVRSPGIDANGSEGFLFWDDVHPSAAAHDLLARAAHRSLQEDSLLGDFNFSDSLDVGDVDLLSMAIRSGENQEGYDLTEDSLVDVSDLDAILELVGTVNGDVDLDQEVAFADFLRLSRQFGQPGFWSDGDLNADGQVSFPDFLILARNFGIDLGEMPAIVPEPVSSRLLFLASFVFVLTIDRTGRRREPEHTVARRPECKPMADTL